MGLYVIEGENLLEEAHKNSEQIQEIVVRKGSEESLIEPWMNREKVYIAEESLFRELVDTVTSQGIMAIVKKPETNLECLSQGKPHANWVVLDRLQDPGNIGTIIRTADAAGYGLIVVMKGTADVFSPKVVRAATGSLFRVSICFANDAAELVQLALKHRKTLVATSLQAEDFYYEVDLRKDIALIVGNEGNGVCEELLEAAQVKIKIPMTGNVESLNASVAAALVMYEAMRKNS